MLWEFAMYMKITTTKVIKCRYLLIKESNSESRLWQIAKVSLRMYRNVESRESRVAQGRSPSLSIRIKYRFLKIRVNSEYNIRHRVPSTRANRSMSFVRPCIKLLTVITRTGIGSTVSMNIIPANNVYFFHDFLSTFLIFGFAVATETKNPPTNPIIMTKQAD